MKELQNLKKDLRIYQKKDKAKILQRFFKTGPGEYGEGDIFLGLKAEEIKTVVKKYQGFSLLNLKKLLASKIHEERTAAVIILNYQFQKADIKGKNKIYKFYLNNLSGINSWDLVDNSAHRIIGVYLSFSGISREILYKLARSGGLWKRRIAIMATYQFIRERQFEETLKLAKILLNDKEDLIHKAVGWMLREVGNRDLATEESFLKKYYRKMPRTMLRYAIEKFPEKKRKSYLKGKI